MHANAGIGRVFNGPPKIPESSRPSKEKKSGRRKLLRDAYR
jgi:hypothetical protein